jgi:hypothetical protein
MMCDKAGLTLRETLRVPPGHLAVAVLLGLAACNDGVAKQDPEGRAPANKALAPVPPTEIATWQKMVSVTTPEGRLLQALAFDEKRKVVVMFGGSRQHVGDSATPMQDLWEWSPATGAWTQRPASGVVPAVRSGAAMVFDPVRNRMLLFGGRGANAYNFEDLWEWDPTTGTWTERSGGGSHPSARTQHGMVYQASTGKILLYGGGRSESDYQGIRVSASLGGTWELDPATAKWTELFPASSPSIRHDFGLVWDSARSKAVLFGGMQIGGIGDGGTAMQDTWEWDPAARTWTECTTTGSRPSQRHGHAMAFDGSRKKVTVFGGLATAIAGLTNDLWEWDATVGTWTQVLAGTEGNLPSPRGFASMVFDADHSRLQLIAGEVGDPPENTTDTFHFVGSSEVWELNPASTSFTDRSTDSPVPAMRSHHAMAYNPATGKTYVWGGVTVGENAPAVLWEWDGASWTKVVTDASPSQRWDAAMAYDPVRKTLILFGGISKEGSDPYDDTWEWSPATLQWKQVAIQSGPAPRRGHAMVTDTTRGKILMFGGSVNTREGAAELWEWDGASLTWSNRSPTNSSSVPAGRSHPVISFDEGLGKLIVYDSSSLSGTSQSSTSFWDWDVATGGWTFHGLPDILPDSPEIYAVYDAARRRHVFVPNVLDDAVSQTWELDAKSFKWYIRSLQSTPGIRYGSAVAYDSARRVVVLFGGDRRPGGPDNDTWEYTVKNLANGEGCTAASAASCASSNCVDGVCCESPRCTGVCVSCGVPGSEGTCAPAQAGTEVPGSCADGQACDGAGSCKTKNGRACSAESVCASGFCVDGVCCDSACGGTCQACSVPHRVGTCTAYASGTDPDAECSQGSGVCKSTCDGVGACTFPLVACGECLTCDGAGTCSKPVRGCLAGNGGSISGGGGSGGGGLGGGGMMGGAVGTGGGGGYAGSSGGSTGSGGSVGSGGSTVSRDGGSTIVGSGGGGGATVSGSGGVGGGGSMPSDAGSADGRETGTPPEAPWDGSSKPDGAPDAGRLVASLRRGGCSCEVGRGDDAPSAWLLLAGLACVVGCLRRRRP